MRWQYRIFGGGCVLLSVGLFIAVHVAPLPALPTDRLGDLASLLLAEDGTVLELRLNSGGYWREPIRLEEIDPLLPTMLIAYEDQRFFAHAGVDFWALGRVMWEFIRFGKFVSGGSTLTMQVVRLLEPKLAQRSLLAKLQQAYYALQLERVWSKSQILEAYFTLAPYGGNLEGLRAATQAWLQKSPTSLTPSEVALLVALPQSPERRRPDRHHAIALVAKNRVLRETWQHLNWSRQELGERLNESLQLTRWSPPSLAPHLLDRLQQQSGPRPHWHTTLHARWQALATTLLHSWLDNFPVPINGAVLIVERQTGRIRSYVGSRHYLEEKRKGGINYLTAQRSPGSTLKPWIYTAALDRGLLAPEQVLEDSVFQHEGYAPENFDQRFWGKITLQEALQSSRNIPAIQTLQRLGTEVVEAQLKSLLGTEASRRETAGLSLAVGGFYLTAEELAQLYLVLANQGSPVPLVWEAQHETTTENEAIFTAHSTEQLWHLLARPSLAGGVSLSKTGTAAHRQDAWAVQLTREHLLLVWLGTPDNEPTPWLTGTESALPLTAQLQQALGLEDPLLHPLAPTSTNSFSDNLRWQAVDNCAPLIRYPEDQAWIRSPDLEVAVQGIIPTLRWYLNGQPVVLRQGNLHLPSAGAHRITASSVECEQTISLFFSLQARDE